MKKLLRLTLLLIAFLSATISFGQVGLTASAGSPTGSFANLESAFDAINLGTHQGAIVITITGTSTETASAVLNASGSGSSSYTSILINPSGAAVITGGISGHLIDLNGANNVTIDGLNTGGNSLTITNTGISSASTIRFAGDASNNTVTNCTLQGSTTIFGVVYFGSGSVTGNDNNTISHCDIGPAGGNNPLNGIYSTGTSTIIDNSSNTITNNNIYDYFNTSVSSSGMNINSFNSAWSITTNRFYQTANRIYTTAGSHYGIFITSGSGYTISGNVLGYANSAGTGTTNMIGLASGLLGGTFPSSYTVGGTANATKYVAINCAFTAGGAVSSIQNNTIAGFALYTSNNSSGTFGVFCGIGVTNGNVNIGTVTGNNIGTATSSIYVADNVSAGAIAGIYVTSSNTVNIQNNVLQNLDAMGTSASGAGSINGINTEGTGGTFVISGNTIGGTNNPSLRTGNLTTGGNLSNVGTSFSAATSGSSLFQGIRNAQTGAVTIGTATAPNIIRNVALNSTYSLAFYRGIYCNGGTTNISYNTISNITSPSTGTSYSSAGLAGIGILMAASTNVVIANNTISGLSLTSTGTGGYTLAGIAYNTPAGSIVVSKNRIYGLSNASASTSATAPGTATGIFIRDGFGANTSIDNNMISLGNGEATNTAFIGIWAQYNSSIATTLKIYYNTINIEGTVTSGAQPSMCFQRGEFSTTAGTVYTINAKNNIFNNSRSGGTGKHYSLTNNYGVATSSATGWGANASDYNVLNSNAATIGYWSGDQTFGTWKTASSGDTHSLSGVSVIFSNSANGDLHLNLGAVPTQIESGGTILPGYTTDFDGQPRYPNTGYPNNPYFPATSPDLGADEFAGGPGAPPTTTLNLTLFLESLYPIPNLTPGIMRYAHNDLGGHQYPGTVVDVITVVLRNQASPYGVVYMHDANLNENGTATLTIPVQYNGSYYITIKHRNSIETCTADPVSFSVSPVSYNFTSAASQAYGANQKDFSDGNFGIYAGDVDQDGGIGIYDMGAVENASNVFAEGYLPEDVNGDGVVGIYDMGIIENNSNAFVATSVPYPFPY